MASGDKPPGGRFFVKKSILKRGGGVAGRPRFLKILPLAVGVFRLISNYQLRD